MTQIIFIRHGEKDRDPVHLSDIGKVRALQLADYLLYPYGEFDAPHKAFIMTVPGRHKSHRCFETMKPTLTKGDLDYELVERSQTFHLAKRLMKLKPMTTVVVCWEHSRIVDFLNIMGADSVTSWGLDPESKCMDKSCFNATWACDVEAGKGIRLRVYRQFDIENGNPVYKFPRTKVWYDKTFTLTSTGSNCAIS